MCHDTDVNFKGKLTRGLKNNIRNLVNFHASSYKSENLHFDQILLSKAYKIQVKKYRRVVIPGTEEKLTLGSKNDMRNLVNFNASSGKSENLHFDVLLLSIAYKVSAEKVQKNYLS